MLCPNCGVEVREGLDVCPACRSSLRPWRTVTDPFAQAEDMARALRWAGSARSPVARIGYTVIALSFLGGGLVGVYAVLFRGAETVSLLPAGLFVAIGMALLVRAFRPARGVREG